MRKQIKFTVPEKGNDPSQPHTGEVLRDFGNCKYIVKDLTTTLSHKERMVMPDQLLKENK